MTGGIGVATREIVFWKLQDWRIRALAGLVVGIIAAIARSRGLLLPAGDAFAYWDLDIANPYTVSTVGVGWSYLYSPAFAQILEPLRAIPWPAVEAGYTSLLLMLLILGTGWVGLITLPLTGVGGEVVVGNIEIPLGAAIAAGLTWPATWAFVLLTKVTPGVGLVWFVVRREWRRLAIALGVTAAIAAISFVLAPHLWWQWAEVLSTNQGVANVYSAISLPLPVRLLLAGVVAAIAARLSWPWLVPGACAFALPILWPGALAMALFGLCLLPTREQPEAADVASRGEAPRPLEASQAQRS